MLCWGNDVDNGVMVDVKCKSCLRTEVYMTRACEQMPHVRMPLPLTGDVKEEQT